MKRSTVGKIVLGVLLTIFWPFVAAAEVLIGILASFTEISNLWQEGSSQLDRDYGSETIHFK